ncbi:hypothetical protein JCM30760_15150 [Thiomicrorhabdus hydrogeniphila]
MNPLRVFGFKLTGVKAHKWQTYSALYLWLFFPYLAWKTHSLQLETSLPIQSEPTVWTTLLFSPIFTVISGIAFILILVHAWVGLRDIMIDYLPQTRVQFWLQLYALFLLCILLDVLYLISQLIS